MKYSSHNASDNVLFCEQVQQVTSIFEQWNDCERTVLISALLKRLPFANLKFLIHSIEHYMKQSIPTHQRLTLMEEAANASTFLTKLTNKYATFVSFTSSTDTIDTCNSDQEQCSGSDSVKSLENDLVMKYTCKEEIVQDLLMYLPLLRPNNDDGKKVYIQFLPVLVEDVIKQNLPVELVQQILSYLLIHPVVKAEDRKNLHQWLQKLQDHLTSGYQSSSSSGIGMNSGPFLPSDTTSSFMSNASSLSSASSSSSASSTTWPTAVPQIQTNTDLFSSSNQKKLTDQEFWDVRNFQVTSDFVDDLSKQTKYPIPIGKNTTSGSASQSNLSISASTVDELHISFSKNGTEVDFESDFIDIPSVSGNNSKAIHAPSTTTSSSNDFLTVPNFFSDRLFDHFYGFSSGAGSDGFSDDGNAIKTRRSNSLTTPNTGACTGSGFAMSSSAENLANLQKPRSFSLSMESSRNAMMSSAGSETRLDDWNKIAQMRFGNNHVSPPGMSNITVWLKSLRLHKYQWLFTNTTYEQMMEMTEEHLENLGVTKGARHKLVLCIQKLPDRVSFLKQLEMELTEGTRPLKSTLDELTNIVMTPMRNINSVPLEEDVATHVMHLLDIAFKVMQSIKFFTIQDEESVNVFMWVLDKAIHHDAFNQQVQHLRDYRYKLQRIKNMFVNKSYGSNNISGSNSSIGKGVNPNLKNRWTSTKQKCLGSNQNIASNISDNPKNRKNSMPYYNVQSYNNAANPNSSSNNKSLSYPSFNSNNNNAQQQPTNLSTTMSTFQRSASREKLNQFTLMQQQHQMQFSQMPPPPPPPQQTTQQQQQSQGGNVSNSGIYGHRHSLNALMPFPPPSQQQQFINRRNSSCGTDRMMQQHGEKNLSETSVSLNTMTTTSTTSDINSRLESLCRQMTEQAIN